MIAMQNTVAIIIKTYRSRLSRLHITSIDSLFFVVDLGFFACSKSVGGSIFTGLVSVFIYVDLVLRIYEDILR